MEFGKCYKFLPSDEELVSILLKRLSPQFPPFGQFEDPWFKDVDLYGKEEVWVIWQKNERRLEHDQTLYCFSSRKKKSFNSVRFCREIGTGTWHVHNRGRRIEAGNNVVGLKKPYSFKHEHPQYNGGWIMDEFSIPSEPLRQQQPGDIVLCRLKKSPKASHQLAVSNETNQSPELNLVPIPAQNPNFMSNAEESYTTFDVQGNVLERMKSTQAETDNDGVNTEGGLRLSTGRSHSPLDVHGFDCFLEPPFPSLNPDGIFNPIDAGDSENVVDEEFGPRTRYASVNVDGDDGSWNKRMKDLQLPDDDIMIGISSMDNNTNFWVDVPEEEL